MPISAIDLLVAAVLLVGARNGCRHGFGEVLWPASRWLLILLAGAAISVPAAQALESSARLPIAAGAFLVYLAVAAAIAFVLESLRLRFDARLLAAIPAGRTDQFLGLCLGLAGTTAAVLIVFALLHPWQVDSIDWNPAEMRSEDAVRALFQAIIGSLRRLVLDESRAGLFAQQHFARLLLPIPGAN